MINGQLECGGSQGKVGCFKNDRDKEPAGIRIPWNVYKVQNPGPHQ